VEEVTDTGFLSNTPTLAVAQMGEDALVQVKNSHYKYLDLSFRYQTHSF
jgi:splicing factor 3B subunit 3